MVGGSLPEERQGIVNPIVRQGADPWVILWHSKYYYCRVDSGNGIRINRAGALAAIGTSADSSLVWTPPSGTAYSENVWAPELHRLDGAWYIYFAADDGRNENHRTYVLRGTSNDPLGVYEFVGTISGLDDRWAIDGTVLSMPDGRRYFIWSGWEGNENVGQNLYIADMRTPVTLSGPSERISTPENAWEMIGQPPVNEGPQALWNGDNLFLIYSASGSWTDHYCLGQLRYIGGNPLSPRAWVKHDKPVFAGANGVVSPGHACFITNRENWIVYHAAKRPGAGWDRDVRAQRFTWSPDGSPDFGEPVAPGVIIQ